MSNLFSITTTTNAVRLDEKRQGEVTFTVSNASERSMRGRALLQPEDPEAVDWLRLEGEAERDFPIAGTEQYTVKITVPDDAPAGSYPFRLDMVGVKRPDEDYTRGQTVTVEVPEAEPEPKPFPMWKALVAAGVLLLVGLIAFILVNGNGDGTDRPVLPPEPVDPPIEETEPGMETTTLTDVPPIPLIFPGEEQREGRIELYGAHAMDPDCTVTNVSARLLQAQGTIEVIDNEVGTNNLRVVVEYTADRENARAEITWEVEHPAGVECVVEAR